jgi:hypothetical protein
LDQVRLLETVTALRGETREPKRRDGLVRRRESAAVVAAQRGGVTNGDLGGGLV